MTSLLTDEGTDAYWQRMSCVNGYENRERERERKKKKAERAKE
jgi:hypothetical protein